MPIFMFIVAWIGGFFMCGTFIANNLTTYNPETNYYPSEGACVAETAKPCETEWIKAYVVK